MNCRNCDIQIDPKDRYCYNCGNRLILPQKRFKLDFTLKYIIWIIALEFVFLAIFHLSGLGVDYKEIFLVDFFFILVTIVFSSFNWKQLITNFRITKKLEKDIVKIIGVSSGFALVIFIVSTVLNENVFQEYFTSYYNFYEFSPAPLLFTLLSIAVIPAVFEELVFRGVLFNLLKSKIRLKDTIIITGALFAISHFSIISLIWHFPLGLGLGYLRARYRSLIPCIFAHFFYNTTIVLIEMFWDLDSSISVGFELLQIILPL